MVRTMVIAKYVLLSGCVFCILSGCQTATLKKSAGETTPDIISAVGSMTEGLTNQDISQEDLRRVAKQAQQDPSVQQAIESVNNAMQATQTGIKYCPLDGKRFSHRLSTCPHCGATLKDLE